MTRTARSTATQPLRGTQRSGRRRRRNPDLFGAAAEGVRDLFSASVDDIECEAGRLYRRIVATGGTCPCGARVASWTWADRLAGVPAPIPRVIVHAATCPAWLGTEPATERNLP